MNFPTDNVWAIQADQFAGIAEKLQALDVRAAAPTAPPKRLAVQNIDGVAIVPLCGILQKSDSILSLFFSTTSTQEFGSAVATAATDPSVTAILIRCDSPGGQVRGTASAADAVYAARQVKPTVAFIEDCGCSGAYWIASQCQQVVANRTAAVGSVGTFSVVTDQSGAAEKLGIKPIVVKAGAHKGDFEPGTKITPEQISELQRMVDSLQSQFNQSVARGRGWALSRAESLADGKIYIGADAVRAGLIDGIDSLQNVIDRLKAKSAPAAIPAGRPMMPVAKASTATPQQIGHAFSVLVREQMALAKCDRQTAIAAIAHRSPKLHQEYLRATGGEAARDL